MAERYAERLEKDLDDAKSEIRRLTDVIIELKREGRELPGPQDQAWSPYTTEEADVMRMNQLLDSHEQLPTTDGGAHTDYAERLELERAAQRALNDELPPEMMG